MILKNRKPNALNNFLAMALIATSVASIQPLGAANADVALTATEKLEKGQVITGIRNVGATKYVTGTIMIDHPPEQVWPVMTNPFEFKGKISPRMKTVEVMLDKNDESILKVTLDMGFLMPNFCYTVDSKYQHNERVEFKRVGGTLKDFSGSWEMKPADNGTKTELTYAMFVDPGFFVPQWIMREGMKNELPSTLTGLRKRIDNVYDHQQALEEKSILASRCQIAGKHSTVSGGTTVWQ